MNNFCLIGNRISSKYKIEKYTTLNTRAFRQIKNSSKIQTQHFPLTSLAQSMDIFEKKIQKLKNQIQIMKIQKSTLKKHLLYFLKVNINKLNILVVINNMIFASSK